MSLKYPLHGCDIELSDDGKTATVSRDGKVLKTFTCELESVLDCLEKKVPTPQVQAQRFAKGYVPPKPEPKKTPDKKTEEPKP